MKIWKVYERSEKFSDRKLTIKEGWESWKQNHDDIGYQSIPCWLPICSSKDRTRMTMAYDRWSSGTTTFDDSTSNLVFFFSSISEAVLGDSLSIESDMIRETSRGRVIRWSGKKLNNGKIMQSRWKNEESWVWKKWKKFQIGKGRSESKIVTKCVSLSNSNEIANSI